MGHNKPPSCRKVGRQLSRYSCIAGSPANSSSRSTATGRLPLVATLCEDRAMFEVGNTVRFRGLTSPHLSGGAHRDSDRSYHPDSGTISCVRLAGIANSRKIGQQKRHSRRIPIVFVTWRRRLQRKPHIRRKTLGSWTISVEPTIISANRATMVHLSSGPSPIPPQVERRQNESHERI